MKTGLIVFANVCLAAYAVWSVWVSKNQNERLYRDNLAISEMAFNRLAESLENEKDRNARLTILLSQCLGADFDKVAKSSGL